MSESEDTSQLKIRCPNCQRRLDVTLLEPFSVFNCPECGFEVTVPKWWREYLFESRVSSNEGVEVYRALDTSLDREVIVELVRDDFGYSSESLESYLACIRRLSGIVDPSLSVVYACGRYEGGVYSVVQYLPEALSTSVRQSWSEVVAWLRPVLRGLEKASAEGIYHGRLGASCLRRTESGDICVSGFGVGMSLENRMSRDGYASPERLSGGEASLAGDIYSLGKVIWRFLAGELPEEGGVLPDDVPGHVVSLLRSMTSLSPYDRPQSYGEILSHLDDSGLSSGAKKVMHRGGGGFQGKVKVNRQVPAMVPMPQSGSGCLPKAIGGFLLLGLAVGLSFLFWSQEKDVSASSRAAEMPSASSLSPAAPSPAVEAVGSGVSSGGASGVSSGGASMVTPSSERPSGGNGVSARRLSERLSADIVPLPSEWRKRRPKMASPLLTESRLVSSFIDSVPEPYRVGVKTQVEIIGQGLGLLRQYTSRVKFDRGNRSRLILYRNSRELRAKVRMANDHGLWLSPLSPSDPMPKSVRLEDLHWISYIEMLSYYGKFSLDRFRELRKGTPEYVSARKALVNHYLVLALMCDWYDEVKEAKKHARQCVELEPKAAKVLGKFGIALD